MAIDANSASKSYQPSPRQTVIPHLTVRNAETAIDFYKAAFGAEEIYRMPDPNGKGLWFAELKIGDSFIFLNDEYPDTYMGGIAPNTLGGTPVTIHLTVKDVDAWFERAVRVGASIAMPLEDMFWGDRYGKVVDPFGHQWSMSSPIQQIASETNAPQAAAYPRR